MGGILVVALVALGFASTALAGSEPFGYWEFRHLDLHGSAEDGAASLRFRPTWKGDLGAARWRLTGEFRAMDGVLSPSGTSRSEGRIERASLEWSFGRDTIRVGRQAVNWGHGLLFNPTDPFRELFLTNPWYERAGVDGLRWMRSIGTTGGLVAAVATVEDWEDRRLALRLFDARPGFDRALVYLRDPKTGRDRIGVDLKGDLGVGWWFEAVRDEGGGDAFHEWVWGIDYTWPVRQGLYLAVQRYGDGSGEDRLESYDWSSLLGGMRRSLGRRYLVMNGRLTWDATWSLHLDLVRNESDGGRILSPHVNWQPTDDRQVHLGVNLYRGPTGSEYAPGPLVDPLGRIPHRIVYVWFRQHF